MIFRLARPATMLPYLQHGAADSRPCGGHRRPMPRVLGASWGHLGASWGHLGASWGSLGAGMRTCLVFHCFTLILKGSGGAFLHFFRGLRGVWGVSRPSWMVLGASWGRPGASWGRLGPSWGRTGASWNSPGASWGHLGASWGRLGAKMQKCNGSCSFSWF